MTDNGAKALAERIHEVILSADYDAEDEAELILANGAVFLTAEEAERLRRIEAAARALDLRPDRAVTDGNAIASLRAALAEPDELDKLNAAIATVSPLRARAVTDMTDPEPSHD